MGLAVVPVFTTEEYRLMERIVIHYVDLFTTTRSEQKILIYIASRTLRFSKFEERIRAGEFIHGSESEWHFLPWGLGYSRTQIYDARQGLKRRGLVDMRGDSVVYYRLNLPGILASLVKVAERLDDKVRVDQFKQLEAKAVGIYRAHDWSRRKVTLVEETVVKIEDKVKEGVEKSERARKKKVRRAIKDQKTGWIKPKMAEWAEEFGLEFGDTWTGREAKSAQRFLKYCEEEDRDPQEILYLVVKNWESIKLRLAHKHPPDKRVLSSVISFSQYFNSRKIIDHILIEIGSEPDPEPVEVITVDEWKRRRREATETEG